MKHLKSLDLGTNRITGVELRGLDALERLYINNNSIYSLKNVTLRDLPNLSVLSLDRNSITRIADGDLRQLGQVRGTQLTIFGHYPKCYLP
jgi:Leucine-rich repeat (LRR) protein